MQYLVFLLKKILEILEIQKVIQIIRELENWGANIKVFDPIVSKVEVSQKYKIKICNFNKIKSFKFDALILAVSHNEFF